MYGVLAFDLGTSGVKCSLFHTNGELIDHYYGEYTTYYPEPNYREQAPSDWINEIIQGTRLLHSQYPQVEICAIGISGHSLGALPISDQGDLLADRVPIWSDARARSQADRFFQTVDYREWYERTGNGFTRELYSLFKIMWYKEHLPDLYRRTSKFIGTKDYLNYFLTGNAVTDISYASGCGCFDLQRKTYHLPYLQAAGIDREKLPEIHDSHSVIGTVTHEAAKAMGIIEGIPVVCGGVDNACMTLGAGCFSNGDTYASLGSSSWITVSVDEPLVDFNSRIFTFAHCVPGQFLPSVGTYAFGSALAWAADRFFTEYTGNDKYDEIGKLAESSIAGAHGVMFNPSLAGGSAFDKSPNIRGSLFNLSLENTKADIARAVFEGITLHLYSAAGVLIRSGRLKDRLLVVGGGAKGKYARQFYADVFGKEIATSQVQHEAAALGAAALAAVGCGLWKDYQPLYALQGNSQVCSPRMENTALYQELLPFYLKMCDACSDFGDAVSNS